MEKRMNVFDVTEFVDDCISKGEVNAEEWYKMKITKISVSGRTVTINLENGQKFNVQISEVIPEV